MEEAMKEYRALILSEKCRLSFPAAIPPRMWAGGKVGYVNTKSKATRNDERY
jgi:hypothetical protein